MEERWTTHQKNKDFSKKQSRKFYNALRKYPECTWLHEILGTCETIEEAKKLEIRLVEEYDTYRNGYNSTKGGDGCPGLIFSKETLEKLRLLSIGRRGKYTRSEETKEKLRLSQIGKKHSLESRIKMSLGKRGRIPWNKGKSLTEETKKRISASQLDKSRRGIIYTIKTPDGKIISTNNLARFNREQGGLISSSNLINRKHSGGYTLISKEYSKC